MDLPVYITTEEVQRVCMALELGDWSMRSDSVVTAQEAEKILNSLAIQDMQIDLEDFRAGLEVELEHGTQNSDANVTNNHPILTGKIVLAHLKETLDYYARLEVAELEGDLFRTVSAIDGSKAQSYYKRLAEARRALAEREKSVIGDAG